MIFTFMDCWWAMRSLANSPRTRDGTLAVRYVLVVACLARACAEMPDDVFVHALWAQCSDKAKALFKDLPNVREYTPALQHWINMAAVFQQLEEQGCNRAHPDLDLDELFLCLYEYADGVEV